MNKIVGAAVAISTLFARISVLFADISAFAGFHATHGASTVLGRVASLARWCGRLAAGFIRATEQLHEADNGKAVR